MWRYLLAVAVGGIVYLWPCRAEAYFADGFSAGLSAWGAIGDVAADAAEAVLADGGAAYSAIYQPVALPPGLYRVEVEVQGGLSAAVPSGTLPDTFFASVYSVDDPARFDLLTGAWDAATPLFDLSAAGFSGVQGALGPSALGVDWTHFAGTFDLDLAYAVPVFELVADNAIAGDSLVRLDNLRIVLIPEPRVGLMLVAGTAVLAARKRRTRCDSSRDT